MDIRRDGLLDLHEWQQSFGRANQGDARLAMRATQADLWENSKQFAQIGFLVAKNRKQLSECFKRVLGERAGTAFSFAEGKAALDDWLQAHWKGQLSDQQLRAVLAVGLRHGESHAEGRYCYERLLDTYKQRFSGPQTK